jgi:hypothetical protein
MLQLIHNRMKSPDRFLSLLLISAWSQIKNLSLFA